MDSIGPPAIIECVEQLRAKWLRVKLKSTLGFQLEATIAHVGSLPARASILEPPAAINDLDDRKRPSMKLRVKWGFEAAWWEMLGNSVRKYELENVGSGALNIDLAVQVLDGAAGAPYLLV